MPGPRTAPPAAPAGDALRIRVLRAALAHERRPRGWPAALPPPRSLVPRPPFVWGCGCSRGPVEPRRSPWARPCRALRPLSPVHLTYTPPPGHGAPPARQPREATGARALLAWAHTACRLSGWEGGAVRAVNAWDFAEQDLPEGGGHAVWSCVRASTWRGPGAVTLLLRTDRSSAAAPGRLVGRARATAACSRFGRDVVAGARRRSPRGHRYFLAVGSRAVVRVEADGAVGTARDGRTLAVRAPEEGTVRVTARLDDGGRLREVGAGGGDG
ncbi:hypothetical protein GCM10010358_57580 [Streptomyces minutiscleroticus]|uniref:Uncharacterized protein n=1 Tax=Streptomyces minutiscleroticus TaxID=68238 RepID=A0A918NU03_9ACTN|nr:hypothetical protein [Streptomyces minutiscleroticus]GGX96319.1 hypothetical protein GCM10010358_57580 [Streptomyces minutiscleroticus]